MSPIRSGCRVPLVCETSDDFLVQLLIFVANCLDETLSVMNPCSPGHHIPGKNSEDVLNWIEIWP